MRILIVSDAWRPQINGVVRTLEATQRELVKLGHEVLVAGPDQSRWPALSLPFYPEITLEFFAGRRLAGIFREFRPDCIHIATEGPLGWTARRMCLARGLTFTTAYHTRFPEYLAARVPSSLATPVRQATYFVLRRFHAPASAVLVATKSVERELRQRGFRGLARWSRGVDSDLFRPYGKNLAAFAAISRPIQLYVGRIAAEKNLRAFLDLAHPGGKVVIGDGPELPALKATYPGVHFLGALTGEALARHYAAADVFVFPSITDTFGLVLLEACAAGLRIAAMPAPGPLDIFGEGDVDDFAVLNADLGLGVAKALQLAEAPDKARAFAQRFSWEACTRQFLEPVLASARRPDASLAPWPSRLARRLSR